MLFYIGFKADRELYRYLKSLAVEKFEGNISQAIKSHFPEIHKTMEKIE